MTGIVDGEQLRLLIRKTLCWKQICRFSFSGRVRLTALRYKNKWDKILESLNFWHSLHCSIYKPTWNKHIKKHVALKSQRRDFFLFFFFKYSFSRTMSIDGTLSSKSARITINWRIKRCLSVASPQTSFGVPLSRIHFSPVGVGGGGNECVTNEPQRTSAGRLAYLTYQKFLVVPNEVKDGIEMVMKSLAQNVYIQCNPWLELWPSVQNCRDVSFKSKNHRLIFLCVKVVWIWITSYLS